MNARRPLAPTAASLFTPAVLLVLAMVLAACGSEATARADETDAHARVSAAREQPAAAASDDAEVRDPQPSQSEPTSIAEPRQPLPVDDAGGASPLEGATMEVSATPRPVVEAPDLPMLEGRVRIGAVGGADRDEYVSPDGRYVAVRTAADERFELEPRLHVIDLRDGSTVQELALSTAETDGQVGVDFHRDEQQPHAAITEFSVLRWSPDGDMLAFTAGLDGPSADLYRLEPATGKIVRLSDAPEQEIPIAWSPDGETILYQRVPAFGTGAGWGSGSIWRVGADGQNATHLLDASGDVATPGWTEDGQLVAVLPMVPSRCGQSNFVLIDVKAGTTQTLAENVVLVDMAIDQASGTLLLSARCCEDEWRGSTRLLLVGPEDSAPRWLEIEGDDLAWDPQRSAFLVTTDSGRQAIDLDGRPIAGGELDPHVAP